MPIHRTAISLVALKDSARLLAFQHDYDSSGPGRSACYELSYGMSPELLDEFAPLMVGRVLSVHASCPRRDSFPNLASADPQVVAQSREDLRLSLDTVRRVGAGVMVLHPGYATDRLVPSEALPRQQMLTDVEFQPYIWKTKGSICRPDYTQERRYRDFAGRALKNLRDVAQDCANVGVKLAIENLNPRVGYLFQTPEEMVSIAQAHPEVYLCVDIGHLWASSCVYRFDYLDALRSLLATGKVVTSHLHSNPSRRASDPTDPDTGIYEDSHSSLDRWQLPYEESVKLLAVAGVNLVLEVKEEPLRNMLLLQRLVDSLLDRAFLL